MQIVIDIPEEKYNAIIDKYDTFPVEMREWGLEAIKNGTPLPKGHGDLIETNTIQSMARKKAKDRFPEGRYDYGYRIALFEFAEDIEDAPIIIEADKAESEDKNDTGNI